MVRTFFARMRVSKLRPNLHIYCRINFYICLKKAIKKNFCPACGCGFSEHDSPIFTCICFNTGSGYFSTEPDPTFSQNNSSHVKFTIFLRYPSIKTYKIATRNDYFE